MLILQQLPNGTIEILAEVATVLGPMVSVLLSALLVILYYNQYQILMRQTELSESGQKALLRVQTYHLFSWLDKFRYENEVGENIDLPGLPDHYASFTALVSNSGTGFAEDILIELVIESPSNRYSVTVPLTHKTNMDQIAFSGDGGVLSPEEGEVLMTAHLAFSREELAEDIQESGVSVNDRVSPSELLWMLEKNGESPVNLAVFIHFKDGTGVRNPKQLLTSQHQLSPYIDLRTAYEWGGPVEGDVEPVFEYSAEETD